MRLQHYIKESIEDKGILKACFMCGTCGAGKSYVLKTISSGSIEPRIVNTDKMTEFFKAFKPEDWYPIADKVKHITKNQLSLYLNSLLPLWIDGTSANPSSLLRRKGILASIGYDTAMVWVDTSLETAIERASKRQRQVKEEDIRSIYDSIKPLKSYYRKEFRDFWIIKNDEGELTDKVILNAYRKTTNFFNSPINNPIGRNLIEDMREKGYKYLIDNERYDMTYIKKLVSTWYQQ